MKKENSLALISDLIILARADNKVTLSEYDFIMRLAFRMDLDKNDVDQLFENPLPSKSNFTELERITHFQKMVLLMNVDRETHDKEIVTIKNGEHNNLQDLDSLKYWGSIEEFIK